MPEDLRVSVPPFEFSIDGKFAVDEAACRAFLERFVREYGKIHDLELFKDELSDAFSLEFDCGAIAAMTVQARYTHINLYDPGGLHTAPARRPSGSESES